ncbi:MAG: CapA family protein [Gemmatimonadota bacterium]|nr:CapA family protein [Gemmatimonadota bacterium]
MTRISSARPFRPIPRFAVTILAAVVASPASGQVGPRPDSGEVRVCAGGDVTLGTNLDTAWARIASGRLRTRVAALPDPDTLLAPLRPLVRDADVLLLNVEGAIGEGPIAGRKCLPGSTQCYEFRQPAGAAAALRRLGGDSTAVIGNLANNHARDAGLEGLRETVQRLTSAGAYVTGEDTLATPVVTPRGDTVAFLGFSTSAGPDSRDLPAVRRYVARASAVYERVVVTMHMGAEGARAQRTTNTTERFLGLDRGNSVAFARAAAEAGASLVVGHGPHVMRGMEWHGGTLIAYSLGNLVTYGPFTLTEPLNRGAILCATLDAAGAVTDATLRSTKQRPPGLVSPDIAGRAAVLADSLTRLDFPRTGATLQSEVRVGRP